MHVWFNNKSGLLTYNLANGMSAEWENLLFERNMCTAAFELWDIQGRGLRSIGFGQDCVVVYGKDERDKCR